MMHNHEFNRTAAAAPFTMRHDRRPGGAFHIASRAEPAEEFEAARWRREWLALVGSVGEVGGKLVLCFSRRVRSPDRLRLLRELRETPGAVAAVLRDYCRDRDRPSRYVSL